VKGNKDFDEVKRILDLKSMLDHPLLCEDPINKTKVANFSRRTRIMTTFSTTIEISLSQRLAGWIRSLLISSRSLSRRQCEDSRKIYEKMTVAWGWSNVCSTTLHRSSMNGSLDRGLEFHYITGQCMRNVHMSLGVGSKMISRELARIASLGVEACVPNLRDCDG
jgi:hypothetical protein